MLLLAAFGVKRHQIDVNVGLRNPLYANVEMARYLIGGFNIALNARLGDRQLLPAQAAGGDIRQQLRRFYRTADFNDSFAMPPSPGSALSSPGASMAASRFSSLTPSSPLYRRCLGPAQGAAPDRPLHVAVAL